MSQNSGIGSATIKRLEVMDGVPSGQVRTLLAIKEALEAAGVEFIGTPDDRPGVRLGAAQTKPESAKRVERS